jgi:hypothetical protein
MYLLVGYRATSSYRYLDPAFAGYEQSRGECLLLLERAAQPAADTAWHPSLGP